MNSNRALLVVAAVSAQIDAPGCLERQLNGHAAQGVGLVAAAGAPLDSILVALMT